MIEVRKIWFEGRSDTFKFDSYGEALDFIGEDSERMMSTLMGTKYKNERGDTFWLIIDE